MNESSVLAVKALMEAGGVPAADIELALRIAEGGLWISSPEICRTLKVKRWIVHDFCRVHEIPVRKRVGRCGNLIKAREFFERWREVRGGGL